MDVAGGTGLGASSRAPTAATPRRWPSPSGEAVARGAARFLTIPGDVPCVTAEEIALAVRRPRGAGVVFVPSLSGFGTNAALLAPPDAMPLKFGEPSFDNHLRRRAPRGLTPGVRELPGLGLDIDAPDDLRLAPRARRAHAERRPSCASWRTSRALNRPPTGQAR